MSSNALCLLLHCEIPLRAFPYIEHTSETTQKEAILQLVHSIYDRRQLENYSQYHLFPLPQSQLCFCRINDFNMYHNTIFVPHFDMANILDLLPCINKKTTRRQAVLIEIQFNVSYKQDGLLSWKIPLHQQRNVLPIHSMVLPSTPSFCDAILLHTFFHISVPMPNRYSADPDYLLGIHTLVQTSH